MINTATDLETLHRAIVADIKAKFPAFKTVEFYRGEAPDDRSTLPVPACLLTLTEFEFLSDDDPGTEQAAVLAHFEAELIIKFTTTKAKMSIRTLAAAFLLFLRLRRWTNPVNAAAKLPTGEAMPVGAYPDEFNDAKNNDKACDQYEVFKVEWQQEVHLGESVWLDEGTPPDDVFARYHPPINPDAYTKVSP